MKTKEDIKEILLKRKIGSIIKQLEKKIESRNRSSTKDDYFDEVLLKNLPSKNKKGFKANLLAAKERIRNGEIPAEKHVKAGIVTDRYKPDIADLGALREELQNDRDEKAIAVHGNDPNRRLDLYGFPMDRKDRKFIFNHNFGEYLSKGLEHIHNHWIFLFGDKGRGKTALGTRLIWEMIKDKPSVGATFISVNSFTHVVNDEEAEFDMGSIKPYVLLDDFDTFDPSKEFRVRQMLRLIEKLKNNHKVIITSNRSLPEIFSQNADHVKFPALLDRIKGKSMIFPRFKGPSFRSKT